MEGNSEIQGAKYDSTTIDLDIGVHDSRPRITGTVTAQTKTGKAPAAGTSKQAELIDLNTATKEQLMTLPGIGDALSQKIIDNRPYRAKTELTQKNIIPQATYDKIADKVIAKQPAATPAGGDKKAKKKPY